VSSRRAALIAAALSPLPPKSSDDLPAVRRPSSAPRRREADAVADQLTSLLRCVRGYAPFALTYGASLLFATTTHSVAVILEG